MSSRLSAEIAATAARLVVEEGMEYGPAKRRAARDLGRHSIRTSELPSNEALEDEVRAYCEKHPEVKAIKVDLVDGKPKAMKFNFPEN